MFKSEMACEAKLNLIPNPNSSGLDVLPMNTELMRALKPVCEFQQERNAGLKRLDLKSIHLNQQQTWHSKSSQSNYMMATRPATVNTNLDAPKTTIARAIAHFVEGIVESSPGENHTQPQASHVQHTHLLSDI